MATEDSICVLLVLVKRRDEPRRIDSYECARYADYARLAIELSPPFCAPEPAVRDDRRAGNR